MRYAVALYMSSVLGSGVLVLPGLAAQIAGPASLIAWLILSLASYPLAYTFASLSARKPESGGVYAFARESFGQRWADAVGWLFIVWYVTGAPVVTVIAASYLSYAIPLNKEMIYVVAALIIIGTFLINYRGSVAPFAAILSNALGVYGAVSTGVLAVFIIFGTVNAYTTGMSRVIYSVAKEGGLPRAIARINTKTGAPHLSLGLLTGLGMITLAVSYFLNIDLQTALLIPSGAAIFVYVIGSALV